MIVKFKRLDENAVIPFKTHDSDFCYDVVATSEEEVAPNVWRYGLGFALQIDRDSEVYEYGRTLGDRNNAYGKEFDKRIDLTQSPLKLSLDFRPRSSVWKTGMSLANCEPTIDEPYTGEIKLVFYHVMPNMPRYRVGDKIAQMKIGATCPINFVEVGELKATERGDGGFGSTGR